MNDTRDSSPIPGDSSTPGGSPIPADLVARWHGHLTKLETALGRLGVDLTSSGSESDVLRTALEDLLAASREIETVERLVSERLMSQHPSDTGQSAAPRRRSTVDAGGRRALVGTAVR